MRLIDADELKKVLNEIFDIVEVITFDDIIKIIDNAPTVEPFEKIGAICNENCGGYRPKGKWEKHSTYDGVLICSNCNHGSNKYSAEFNYCPNCGADMRGDEK